MTPPERVYRNIADLRRLWDDRFGFWRGKRHRHQHSVGKSSTPKTYVCRAFHDRRGQVMRFEAPTAQALAKRLIEAGYPPKENE